MLHRSLIQACVGDEVAARRGRARAPAASRYALAAFGPLATHRR
ncbi:MAG TPA: hypothetical protein VFR63_08195 [Gaiellaceae bacterium]|nr:hypothetical protein [Gaiellaceae bacterium]